jgi:hypothetical protein
MRNGERGSATWADADAMSGSEGGRNRLGAARKLREVGTVMNRSTYVEAEAFVDGHSTAVSDNGEAWSKDGSASGWANILASLIWLVAGAVAFLPFAFDTSPWDAVILRVPGNQGNWWHVLAGAPFFLAYPMIWLRLRSVFSKRPLTPKVQRLIWGVVGLSIIGTILVETPFLLHLAGTSDWQRLAVLSPGFGIVIASAVLLLLRRRYMSPTQACLVGLNTAYLANLALCLVVYSEATGTTWSRSGWLVSMVLVWPIAFELIWLSVLAFRERVPPDNPRPA